MGRDEAEGEARDEAAGQGPHPMTNAEMSRRRAAASRVEPPIARPDHFEFSTTGFGALSVFPQTGSIISKTSIRNPSHPSASAPTGSPGTSTHASAIGPDLEWRTTIACIAKVLEEQQEVNNADEPVSIEVETHTAIGVIRNRPEHFKKLEEIVHINGSTVVEIRGAARLFLSVASVVRPFTPKRGRPRPMKAGAELR